LPWHRGQCRLPHECTWRLAPQHMKIGITRAVPEAG
jgi:hypothetical protein